MYHPGNISAYIFLHRTLFGKWFVNSSDDVQKSRQTESISERPETGEKAANAPIPYPIENARHDYTADSRGLRVAAAMADKPVQRTSLNEKLEAFKVKAAGKEKQENHKDEGKEVTM